MEVVSCRGAQISVTQLDPLGAERPNAPDIVLVHGLASNMAFWYGGVAMMLRAFGRVTVLDLRGHGLSSMPATGYTAEAMAEDLSDVLDFLGLDRVFLIGHFYGGLVSFCFATNWPDRVRALVLADSRLPVVQPRMALGSWSQGGALKGMLKELGVVLDENDGEFGVALLTAIARLKLESPERAAVLEQKVINSGRVMGKRSAKRWIELLDNTTAAKDFQFGTDRPVEALNVLKAPTFALYGRKSMTLKSGVALARACPRARFHVIPGAGHFFPASRPKEFAMRTAAFLTQEGGIRPAA